MSSDSQSSLLSMQGHGPPVDFRGSSELGPLGLFPYPVSAPQVTLDLSLAPTYSHLTPTCVIKGEENRLAGVAQ